MAGKSTISITFKLDGDGKGFKELANSADGLKGVLTATISQSDQLKKSLVNWSQSVQAIDAITNTINNVSTALSAFSDKMKTAQQENVAVSQLTGKTGDEMLKLRNSVKAVADYFGEDFNETLRGVNALAKGFGITTEEAMRLIKDGFVSGANAQGDFVDTLKEYPRYFKEAGLSAEQFVAIATNASKQGIYSDKGVDVIKEGNLRIREMTTATAAALENIGISAEKVQADLQSGSITTFGVMQQVAAKLNELPASSAAVGTAIADIFGGPGEDAGLDYIKTLANVQLNMEAVKTATGETAKQQEKLVDNQEKFNNALSVIDLSGMYAAIQPFVDLTAQVGITVMGVSGFIKTLRELNAVQALVVVKNKAVAVSMVLLTGKTTSAAAVTRVFSAALKTGAYSVTAFKIALKGLMIATGVGIAIAALTTIIEQLAMAEDEAAEKSTELDEATDAYTAAAAGAKVEIEGEISKLRGLIDAKEDTTAAVADLNSKYGEAFGYYNTAAQWYDVLTKKSSDYAKQVGYEAQARVIAGKIAEKEIERQLALDRKKALADAGQATEKYKTIGTKWGASGKKELAIVEQSRETEAYRKEREAVEACDAAIAELNKQMEATQGLMKANSTTLNTLATDTEKVTISTMTWKQVTDEIARKENLLKSTTDAARIKQIRAEITALKERKKVLDAQLGLNTGGGNAAPAKANTGTATTTGLIAQTEAKLTDARKRLTEATSEAAIEAINKEIKTYESQLDAYRKLGVEVAEAVNDGVTSNSRAADPINIKASNLQDISDNIEILNDRLQTATIEEAALINQQIAAWDAKADAIRNAGKVAEQTAIDTGQALKDGWGGIKGFGNSIEGITESLQGNGNAWQTVVGIIDGFVGLYEGIQTVVGIINLLTAASAAHAVTKGVEAGAETTEAATRATAATTNAAAATATIIANKLEAASWKELAAAKYMAAHAAIPFAGFGIAAGFTAAMLATVTAAGIPMLAEGGVATGPTLAMVGEYAGASGNPEVIAPLDKLRGMLADTGSLDFSTVKFEIKGRTLVGILEKESNIIKRS